jgi:hypothetical protein
MDQVTEVLERLAKGESGASIAKAVGIGPTIVGKIKDGWRPVGRKPVRLIPSRARQRGER